MKFIEKSSLEDSEIKRIRELWNSEYPSIISHSSFRDTSDYLNKLINPAHIFCLNEENEIMAWFCDFDRDDEHWFVMIIDSRFQNKGIGSEFLDRCKKKNELLNGWIVVEDAYELWDGRPYKSPLGFYLKNDFEAHYDVSSDSHKLKTIKVTWKRNPVP